MVKQLSLSTLFGKNTASSAQPVRSLGGPGTVMDTAFHLAGKFTITLETVGRQKFILQQMRHHDIPLEGGLYLELRCFSEQANAEVERGFLHRYSEIGGSACWKRLWCVLDGDMLKFWKYPEEENDNKQPIADFDLKTCISNRIEVAPSEITSRPNSFAFESYDKCFYILSADSKAEAATWTEKLNRVLYNRKLWHADEK